MSRWLSRLKAAWWVLTGGSAMIGLTFEAPVKLGPGRVFTMGNVYKGGLSGAGRDETRIEDHYHDAF